MTRDVTNLIVNKLARCCEENNHPQLVEASMRLQDLHLASLDLMEVVYELEQELDISLEATELHALVQVSDLVAAVNRARMTAA